MKEAIGRRARVIANFRPACDLFVTNDGNYHRSIPFDPELPETEIRCPTGPKVLVSTELEPDIRRKDNTDVTVVCRGCRYRKGFVSVLKGRIGRIG